MAVPCAIYHYWNDPGKAGRVCQAIKQGMSLRLIPWLERSPSAGAENLLPAPDYGNSLNLVCFGEHFAIRIGSRWVDQRDPACRQIEGTDDPLVPANHDQ
jgi:hypothetical protein